MFLEVQDSLPLASSSKILRTGQRLRVTPPTPALGLLAIGRLSLLSHTALGVLGAASGSASQRLGLAVVVRWEDFPLALAGPLGPAAGGGLCAQGLTQLSHQ